MHAPSAAPVQSAPNVTPMIDVMLVLLIVFMVVAPALMNEMLAVPPAAVHLTDHPEDPADHTLGIDANGGYYLDKRPIAKAELEPRLRALYARTEDRVLYLRADRRLDYEAVLDAMDAAARSGVRVVGMVSERRR